MMLNDCGDPAVMAEINRKHRAGEFSPWTVEKLAEHSRLLAQVEEAEAAVEVAEAENVKGVGGRRYVQRARRAHSRAVEELGDFAFS